ncbi:hypothetical protein AaE_006383, partial [Aphanomyces astaci]
MLRSCEECRHVVMEGDPAEWLCTSCGGMFHGTCVRNKRRRSEPWECSGCQGLNQEKGLLVTEAVNKLNEEADDADEEWWTEMEGSSMSLPLEEVASNDINNEANREPPPTSTTHQQPDRSNDDECREIVDTDETFRIQSNGVCTRCGLISIPEIHVLSCTVCHETSAHSLCMKPHLRKKWSCPGCFSGGQRRAKAASNNPALHIIQPLANPLPESSVVLCDNCEGEFSMTHLKMSSLPKGDWFCQHCDASAAVADDDVSAPPTTSSSTRRAAAGMSTATAPSRTTPLRSASKRGRVDAAPPPKTSSRRTRGEPTCVRCDKVPGIESSCKECRRVATGQHKAPKRTRLPLRVVVPEPVAVASDTSTVADTAAVDLWTMHEMVGRTVLVYMAASSGQWLSGRVGFFDPHTLLHRVQFLDDTDQWLPLHEMPYCYSQHVNVFVKLDQPNAWWPAQLMSTNDVAARHMQPTDKTLVYLYGGDNVCAWVSMSSVRCFDVFEADACDPSNASWADAVDDAKEEMHLARET